MAVTLYWMSISHPSQVARKMLDLKGVEYKLVDVLPLNQRIHLRLARFSGGTVPALKRDGTLTLDPPNAAALQIMASVNLMGRLADLAELVASHACAKPARELFPRFRAELPPFLDPEWLEPVRIAARA